MYLDEPFKEENEPMPVKRKGISAVGKYQFGSYKVISGKQGWTKTKSKSNFFTNDTNSESETKLSFNLSGEGMDTISANIVFQSVSQISERNSFAFRALTNWSYLEKRGSEVYTATYTSSSDTSSWNLVLAYPIKEIEIDGSVTAEMLAKFKGVISNSEISIDIIPEFKWENGKPSSMFRPLEAYTFVSNGETIAAVQVFPKKYVWIKKDLPAKTQQMLAAASVTLHLRSDNALSE